MRKLLALLVVAVLGLSSCSLVGGGGDGYTVTAWFPRAVALYESSDVRVLGLVAGEITGVDVVGSRVKVTMRVNDDVPLPRDVNAMIVPQSLIGERYVQLFPAWKQGEARLRPGAVIPEARTSIPVEPDEALAALKKFLDTLDPTATGEVVKNLAADLQGTGEDLNRALDSLASLTSTVASKDREITHIIDQFDGFTATLRTREQQLGTVLDRFAQLTGLLAEERRSIESLVRNLGAVSNDAVDLVSEHGAALDRDIRTLTRTLQSVNANLDSVKQVLDAGPAMATGLQQAHDPVYHRIDLRTQFTPLAQQALLKVLGPLGVPLGEVVCLPVDVDCKPNDVQPGAAANPVIPPLQLPAAAPTLPAPSTTTTTAAPSTTTSTQPGILPTLPPNPIDGLLGLFGAAGAGPRPAAVAAPTSTAEDVAGVLAGFGRFLRRAAVALVGVAS